MEKLIGILDRKWYEKFILFFYCLNPDAKLIDKILPLNLQRFAPIKLILDFERVFNKEKRTSYWTCELVGVE